ncbi:hypothetical protein LBMAG21_09260 [Armatimonadota bacterium]|nr:hypothetical protein LBMAG21_09260 [Armatimonadota bacterium]
METTTPVEYPWDQDGYYREYHNRMRMIALYASQFHANPVLDLGCGHGKMRDLLTEGTGYYGCDGHWDKPPYEDAPYENWLFQNDNPALPFGKTAFGAIVCSGLIEYIDDQSALFMAIYDRLKPGGHFICSAINPNFLPFLLGRYHLPKGKWHPAWHHVRPYRAVLNDMKQAGFELCSYTWVPEKANSEEIAKQAVADTRKLGESLPSFRNFSETQILFVAQKPS